MAQLRSGGRAGRFAKKVGAGDLNVDRKRPPPRPRSSEHFDSQNPPPPPPLGGAFAHQAAAAEESTTSKVNAELCVDVGRWSHGRRSRICRALACVILSMQRIWRKSVSEGGRCCCRIITEDVKRDSQSNRRGHGCLHEYTEAEPRWRRTELGTDYWPRFTNRKTTYKQCSPVIEHGQASPAGVSFQPLLPFVPLARLLPF